MTESGRNIIEGRLPERDLPRGQVILRPSKRRFRILKHVAATKAMLRIWWRTRNERSNIQGTDCRGLRKKIERIQGVLISKMAEETFSPQTLHDAGFRLAKCECPKGCDCLHCIHPPRHSNSQLRRNRRNRPAGKR